MLSPSIIVDSLTEWSPYASGPNVVAAADYLAGGDGQANNRRIINLCRDGSYLSIGYYVSLLTEARGKRAMPSVSTLIELTDPDHVPPSLSWHRSAASRDQDLPDELLICFGRSQDDKFNKIANAIFGRYPAPIIHARLKARGSKLVIDTVRIGAIDQLNDQGETFFAESLDLFSRRVWRNHSHRNTRFDLAILVDPNEEMPPSDKGAIRLFERAARSVGFSPEVITLEDSPRLLEFDALLIRCTTAINHITYQLARRAEREGMAVIDDPESILKCCNKVFLHDLLSSHHIGMPPSHLVTRDPQPNYDQLVAELGLPMVLKIPDGSFSRGVFKVEDSNQLITRCQELLAQSAVIIAQAFVPTPFDWRIGVLEGRALYACRYHMARDHWQIVNHASTKSGRLGDHDCVPLSQVPSTVARTAVKAARLIGDGLYGVDIKDVDGHALVIEINDNPSLESEVEDQLLGEELYRQIVAHLMNKVQARGRTQ
ncbi:MAG: RimK family protein [Planctomycetota bacterium]|jgi:glutathione synthase/RimK-type ligase-like ATP-grasp enzyme|nr:RimK family protein [Planctomycetota bacterium]